MNAWTDNELTKIETADELHIATLKQDGTLRNPVTIWVVRSGDEIFIRAVKGPDGLWFRHAIGTHQGHINAGGVEKEVTFEETKSANENAIDEAYKSKYHKYGESIVNSTLTPQAKAATLKVIPK